jgi:hypothetical protein
MAEIQPIASIRYHLPQVLTGTGKKIRNTSVYLMNVINIFVFSIHKLLSLLIAMHCFSYKWKIDLASNL